MRNVLLFSIAVLSCLFMARVSTSASVNDRLDKFEVSSSSEIPEFLSVPDTIRITLDKDKELPTKKMRDLMPDVNARVNIQAGTIDLDLYETGETTVYIVDSHNEVVSEDCFYSGSYLPASVALPLTPGRYWIVIDADYIYAEGVFVR